MSDGSLSQDEIDALLQGSGGMDFDSGPTISPLSDAQKRDFEALIRGTLESQKSNLSMLVSNEVTITPPSLDIVDAEQLGGSLPSGLVQIRIDLTEGAPGHHSYVMGDDAAIAVAGPMMGMDDVDIDDASVNALQEAFSQISGPVITALGDRSGATVMNAPPTGVHGGQNSVSFPDGPFVKLTYGVTIGGGPAFQIHELFDAAVVRAALGAAVGAAQPAAQPMAAGSGMGSMNMGGMGPGFGAPQPGAVQSGWGGNPSVQSVQFPNLGPGGVSQEQGNIGLLMDVYMEMTVELGRTRKLIKEILGMGEGTIIELDKLAGEPVDILVNHKLIAKGEVVVIDENFGVRVTEIVSPMERMSGMP